MKKYSFLIFAVLLLFIGVFLLTNKKTPQSAQTIKIGYFGPLSGALAASTGAAVVDSIRLANEQKNTPGNKKIEMIYEDDACDPKKAVTAATKLMEIDKVNVLISGVCSGSTLAVAPLAGNKKVILISPVAASPKLTGVGDYFFRLSASSELAAQAAADLLKEKGFQKIGILAENNEYPIGWRDAFVQKYAQEGRETFAEVVNSKDLDVKSQLSKLLQKKPDAILLLTLSPALAKIELQQIRELGIMIPLIGNEVFSLNTVMHDPNVEGMLVVMYAYDQNSSEFKSFSDAYRVRYDKEIPEPIYGALGYDTYQVLYQVIDQCGGDNSECIKDELSKVKNWIGASGMVTIDENGDTERGFVLKKIESGMLVGAK